MPISVLNPSRFLEWKDTASWVKYRAIDRDGSMWYFELRPHDNFNEWLMDGTGGRLEYAGYTTEDMKDAWHGTLEERPELPVGNLT